MRRTILVMVMMLTMALGYGLLDSATAQDGETPVLTAAAAAGAPVVGETLPGQNAQLIVDPGRYGLGPALSGTRYAIANGWLVRVEAQSLTVQSILWQHGSLTD